MTGVPEGLDKLLFGVGLLLVLIIRGGLVLVLVGSQDSIAFTHSFSNCNIEFSYHSLYSNQKTRYIWTSIVHLEMFPTWCAHCGDPHQKPNFYFLKSGCPIGVPTWVPDRVPIRGPEGARKRKNFTKWNRAKYVHLHAYMPAPKGQ